MTIAGVSEAEIARFLIDTPGFFERHAEALATVRLTSPHGMRAVSLQERQMEMLRDKTEGRRSAEEDALLADLLFQLRMAYVERTRAVQP